jgi:hypothetical protein
MRYSIEMLKVLLEFVYESSIKILNSKITYILLTFMLHIFVSYIYLYTPIKWGFVILAYVVGTSVLILSGGFSEKILNFSLGVFTVSLFIPWFLMISGTTAQKEVIKKTIDFRPTYYIADPSGYYAVNDDYKFKTIYKKEIFYKFKELNCTHIIQHKVEQVPTEINKAFSIEKRKTGVRGIEYNGISVKEKNANTKY